MKANIRKQIVTLIFGLSLSIGVGIYAYAESCSPSSPCQSGCECVGEMIAGSCTPDQGSECCACYQGGGFGNGPIPF